MEYTKWDDFKDALYDLGQTLHTLFIDIPLMVIRSLREDDEE